MPERASAIVQAWQESQIPLVGDCWLLVNVGNSWLSRNTSHTRRSEGANTRGISRIQRLKHRFPTRGEGSNC